MPAKVAELTKGTPMPEDRNCSTREFEPPPIRVETPTNGPTETNATSSAPEQTTEQTTTNVSDQNSVSTSDLSIASVPGRNSASLPSQRTESVTGPHNNTAHSAIVGSGTESASNSGNTSSAKFISLSLSEATPNETSEYESIEIANESDRGVEQVPVRRPVQQNHGQLPGYLRYYYVYSQQTERPNPTQKESWR
jgi:hypothetical protein